MTRFSIQATFKAIDNMTKPVRKMASDVNKTVHSIGGSFQKTFRHDMVAAEKRVHAFGNSFKNIGGKIRGALGGIMAPLLTVFSIAAISQFGAASIEAFGQSQAAAVGLEQKIKLTNNAVGITAKEFSNMAASFQKNTIFEDDSIITNVTTQLLTFGNIGKSNFERVQAAVLDATAGLKGISATSDDLTTISKGLGRALEDPTKASGALRKMNIVLSDAQNKEIKSLMAQNKTVEAQGVILAAVESKYKDAAKTLGGTDAGKIIQKQNKIGDSMEAIGEKLIPLKAAWLGFLSGIMPIATEFFGIISDAGQKLLPALKPVTTILMVLFKVIVWLIKAIAPFAPLIIGVAIAFGIYNAVLTVMAAVQAVAAIGAMLLAAPFYIILIVIGLVIGIIILCVMHIDKITAAFKWLGGKIVEIAKYLWSLKDVFLLLLGPIGIFINAITAIVTRWNEVKAAFESGGIIGAIKAIGSIIYDSILAPFAKIWGLIQQITGAKGKFTGNNSPVAMGMPASAQAAVGGVTTTSQSVSRTITERNNNQTVTLRNEATGVQAAAGSAVAGTGQRLQIRPSGA